MRRDSQNHWYHVACYTNRNCNINRPLPTHMSARSRKWEQVLIETLSGMQMSIMPSEEETSCVSVGCIEQKSTCWFLPSRWYFLVQLVSTLLHSLVTVVHEQSQHAQF
mmetsp:Transcript_29455/g.68163  ORF Transcript_29455/g.68163 Transcript_29455/m.68163 type:complete len:108 (+) Transcript_29455:882-1205(+)